MTIDIMPYVLWTASIMAIVGSILNVKKLGSCFVIWTICNVFWLAYDIANGSYARAALGVVNLATAIWGMFEWLTPFGKKTKKNTKK